MVARIAEALLGDKAFGLNKDRVMLDPRFGGQNGYSVDLPTYVNHTPYVQQQLIVLLLSAPTGFQFLPEPDVWVGTLKAIFENQAQTIEGFRAKLTGDFASVAFGAAGEEQEVIRDVKRERTQISVTLVEREGRPFTEFFDMWLTYFGKDPDTKWPLITTMPADKRPTDNLPDTRSASILAMEPNVMLVDITSAWVVIDLFPKEGFEVNGKFDKTSPGDTLTATIPFTGVAQSGYGVRKFAKQVLAAMNFTGANPNMRTSVISEFDPRVSKLAGYSDLVTKVAQEAATI